MNKKFLALPLVGLVMAASPKSAHAAYCTTSPCPAIPTYAAPTASALGSYSPPTVTDTVVGSQHTLGFWLPQGPTGSTGVAGTSAGANVAATAQSTSGTVALTFPAQGSAGIMITPTAATSISFSGGTSPYLQAYTVRIVPSAYAVTFTGLISGTLTIPANPAFAVNLTFVTWDGGSTVDVFGAGGPISFNANATFVANGAVASTTYAKQALHYTLSADGSTCTVVMQMDFTGYTAPSTAGPVRINGLPSACSPPSSMTAIPLTVNRSYGFSGPLDVTVTSGGNIVPYIQGTGSFSTDTVVQSSQVSAAAGLMVTGVIPLK